MNKKYFLLTCLAAFPFALTAQENNRYEEITNPKLTSINREPARSTFTSYVTELIPSSMTARTEHSACPLTGNGNSIMWKPSPTAPRTS